MRYRITHYIRRYPKQAHYPFCAAELDETKSLCDKCYKSLRDSIGEDDGPYEQLLY